MIQIINGNALDELKKLPDGSIDCVVTSPPYYGLRSYKGAETIWGGDPDCKHEWSINISERVDYTGFKRNRSGLNKMAEKIDGHERHATTDILPIDKNSVYCSKCGAWKGQLGLEPTYQLYVKHIVDIFHEVKRILKKTGSLYLNLGDTYSGSWQNYGSRNGGQRPKNTEVLERKGSPDFYPPTVNTGIAPKCLIGIPERVMLAMIDDGWVLRNKLIWYKVNGMPSSVKDRFSTKWEYIFFFVKSRKYYFDLDAVRKPLADPDRMLRAVSGKRLSSQEAIDTFFGNPPKGISKPRPNIKHDLAVNRKGSYDDPLHTKPYNLKGANPGDVIDVPLDVDDFLDIPTRPHTFAHFAVYPETLVEPLIKAGCPPNGVVLDPFAGSGTTGVVARKLGRSAILVEISSEYIDIIKQRLSIERNEVIESE